MRKQTTSTDSVKTHRQRRTRDVYVGFLADRPHVQQGQQGQQGQGARVLIVYLSRAAARRAYTDVRKARVVFDAN